MKIQNVAIENDSFKLEKGYSISEFLSFLRYIANHPQKFLFRQVEAKLETLVFWK